MPSRRLIAPAALFAALALGGCAGAQRGEVAARDQMSQIGRQLPPAGRPADPASLGPDSTLPDYERFAALNHPAVAAAYQDWRASVEAIAPTRSLPDPQFVFEADVTDTLLQFMPGLMFSLTTGGKREAMAREATASSRVAYRAYAAAVVGAASDVRTSWIELAYLDGAVRLKDLSIEALGQAADVAEADYATGRGTGTLEDQVRLATERAKAQSEAGELRHRLITVRGRLKYNLGLHPGDPDPAWPRAELAATPLPAEDELWRRILLSNPGLAQMRATVDAAVASVEVARSAGTPDLSVGAMADLKASPILVRPLASVTLPVWREKIAAMTAAAEARRDAALARVGAEELSLAARLAEALHMVHESDSMISYIDGTALPGYGRTVATVEAGYQSGKNGMAAIPEAGIMTLAMRIERLAALRDRENAVTDLLLLSAEAAPAGSPLVADTPTRTP